MGYKDITPLHFGISVGSIDEALAWYEKMLGFHFTERVVIPNVPFQIVFMEKDGFGIEIFEVENAHPLPEERRHPNTDNCYMGTKHMCFHTDDIPALAADLKAKGAEIIIGPQHVGNTTMFFLRDPWGVCIEFIGPYVEL